MIGLGPVLGLALLGVGLRGRVDKSLVSDRYFMENSVCEVGMLKGIYCRNCSSIFTIRWPQPEVLDK